MSSADQSPRRFWGILGWILSFSVLGLLAYQVVSRQLYIREQLKTLAELREKLKTLAHENEINAGLLDHLQNARTLIQVREGIEKEVERERGLSFEQPVNYKRLAHDDLRGYIQSQIKSQYPGNKFLEYEMALKRMDLIPRETNLMQLIGDLFSEQVAAFYDPEEHALFTYEETDFTHNLSKTILAHELVHALQDQNLNLTHLPLKDKENDDASLAASALVEGDATLLMDQYLAKNFQADGMMKDMGYILGQRYGSLTQSPVYLRDTLLFPYTKGLEFVMQLNQKGGWAAVNHAFQFPPRSTEQVLHPEKYFSHPPDDPKRVVIRSLDAAWKPVYRNVLGEWGIQSLLKQQINESMAGNAARGWGGDQYVIWEKADGTWILIWKSDWDSAQDAREFFDSLEKYYQSKYRLNAGGQKAPDEPAVSVLFTESGRKQGMFLQGTEVTFIDASDSMILNEQLRWQSSESTEAN